MHIQLLRTDTTSLKVDALVYPEESPELAVGRAVVTTGGNLLCRFVIHVKIAHANEPDADANLRQSTIAALERAEELAIASVGLPNIGGGSFGFDIERCARVMIAATIDFRSRARSLQRAVFCLLGSEEYNVFHRVWRELEP